MKTIKRLIAIVSIVLMLLLSCVPLSSALAADYSDFFLDISEIEEKGFEYVLDDVKEHAKKSLGTYADYVDKCDYYFASVHFSNTFYSEYKAEKSSILYVYYYAFNSAEPYYEDDEYIVYDVVVYSQDNFSYSGGKFSYRDTYSFRGYDLDTLNGYKYFIYHKESGRFTTSNNTSFNFASSSSQNYFYLQDSNLPDFPFADGVNHNSGGLNVSVDIDPDLVGKVNSTLAWNGQELENPFIRFNFSNNGKKIVHYSFFITDPGYDICSYVNVKPYAVASYSFPDPVRFVLIKEVWQQAAYLGDSYTKAKGENFWQIQTSGTNSSSFICWSQMQLLKDKNYDVVVLAYESDLDFIPHFNNPKWSDCQGKIVEVYRSTFSLSKDTNFNPNDDSFGNSSYIPGQILDNDHFSQYVDGDGNIQSGNFTSGDISGNRNSSNHIYDGTPSGSSSGGSFNSLSYSISGFFSFFNQVFSLLPSNFISVISLGITSIIVISIFKGVFR